MSKALVLFFTPIFKEVQRLLLTLEFGSSLLKWTDMSFVAHIAYVFIKYLMSKEKRASF